MLLIGHPVQGRLSIRKTLLSDWFAIRVDVITHNVATVDVAGTVQDIDYCIALEGVSGLGTVKYTPVIQQTIQSQQR